ncbi:MAG: ECF-type sigma factor [Pseudomonadota bacterium]
MDITELLQAANAGQNEALEQLAPIVYDELRWLAHRQMRREAAPRTLSTTALVNEAFIKLVNGKQIPDNNRAHFFSAAARAMRQIMVSEARRRYADKRGGMALHLTIDSAHVAAPVVASCFDSNDLPISFECTTNAGSLLIVASITHSNWTATTNAASTTCGFRSTSVVETVSVTAAIHCVTVD